MGHIHLGVLPRTLPWRRVVSLLDGGAADDVIVSQSARAAEKDLTSAASDPVYVEAIRILLSLPLAARADDFGAALRDVDISAPDRPELLDLVRAATRRLDVVRLESSSRTDLGELAGRALVATLSVGIGDQLPGLFDPTHDDVRNVARKMSWNRGIAAWSRQFYSRLVADCLSYWLDRTLAEQVGESHHFGNVTQRAQFDAAVHHYSHEATRIIEEFSGGWYGKTIHREGHIGTNEATVFGAVALKKIVAELRVKRGEDA